MVHPVLVYFLIWKGMYLQKDLSLKRYLQVLRVQFGIDVRITSSNRTSHGKAVALVAEIKIMVYEFPEIGTVRRVYA